MDYSTGWEAGTESLYLDDARTPRPNHWFNWVIVRNYAEFVRYITQRGVPKMISFDHDLADEHVQYFLRALHGENPDEQPDFIEKTGMACAKWLVNYCLDNDIPMPHFTVHSANPSGAENILSLLNGLQQAQGQIPNGYRTAW